MTRAAEFNYIGETKTDDARPVFLCYLHGGEFGWAIGWTYEQDQGLRSMVSAREKIAAVIFQTNGMQIGWRKVIAG